MRVQTLSPGDSSNPCTPVLEGLAGHAQSFQVQQLNKTLHQFHPCGTWRIGLGANYSPCLHL